MINLNSEILSGKGLAGVCLGDNISIYMDEMFSNFDIEFKEYSIPNGDVRNTYSINSTVIITTLPEGLIISIGCNEQYNGYYEGVLCAGQTMKYICDHTQHQQIHNGGLVVNNDFGLLFEIPAPYDELADDIEKLPLALTFNEIYVGEF